MRVAVLLGAGASRDAGLKTTYGLAQDLIERINSSTTYTPAGVPQALNFVYGEMAAHRGAHGENPLNAVNTETLISAVRLLAQRDSHEADPFVASWKNAPGVFNATASSGGAALRSALERDRDGIRGIGNTNAIAWAVRRIATDQHSRIYSQLEESLLETVSAVLAAHGDVSYLHPLVQLALEQDGLDIATLNYDLTIESAARDLQIPVHRGVEDWTPGTPMNFTSERGSLNLFKLHGSIDWEHISADEQRQEWYDEHGRGRGYPVVAGRSVKVSNDGPVDRPAIIIGDREKLNGEGPTLALISAFEHALAQATHLAIVGYSFADVHVNALIRSWVNADSRRSISVVDPYWRDRYQLTGFQYDLLDALRPEGGIDNGEVARMDVVRADAKIGLVEAVRGPRQRPASPVMLECERTDSGVELRLTNTFTDLRDVRVSTHLASRSHPLPSPTEIGDAISWQGKGPAHLVGDLAPGQEYTTPIISKLAPGTEFTLRVDAADHQDEWDYLVTVRWPDEQ